MKPGEQKQDRLKTAVATINTFHLCISGAEVEWNHRS